MLADSLPANTTVKNNHHHMNCALLLCENMYETTKTGTLLHIQLMDAVCENLYCCCLINHWCASPSGACVPIIFLSTKTFDTKTTTTMLILFLTARQINITIVEATTLTTGQSLTGFLL
jgi:hypothetical protein